MGVLEVAPASVAVNGVDDFLGPGGSKRSLALLVVGVAVFGLLDTDFGGSVGEVVGDRVEVGNDESGEGEGSEEFGPHFLSFKFCKFFLVLGEIKYKQKF